MLWVNRIVLSTFGLSAVMALAGACGEDLGADACETPGTAQDCTCPSGRVSVRSCRADSTLGECYCYEPGCGNGQVDDGEECDDGNTASGDGCDAMCIIEPGGPGGGNPVTSSTTTGNPVTSTTTGMGGMMGTGGMMSSGGMGGVGGAGGAGGV